MNQSLLPNIQDFIAHIDPFDKLSEAIQKQVAASVQITYLSQGESISPEQQSQEKYLYIVRTGAMEQRKLNGQLRGQLGVGDLFGFTLLLDNKLLDEKSKGYTATAIENTLLYMVPNSELQSILQQHPQFADFFATSRQARLKTALEVTWSGDEKGHFLKTVGQVANNNVVTVSSEESVRETAQFMRDQRRSSAVIMDDGNLIGIVTDRDMTKRVVADGFDIDRPIIEVMTRTPQTVRPKDLMLKAVTLMVQHNVRSLPVVEDGKVSGILTAIDMIQNHRMQAVYLIGSIDMAKTLEALVDLVPQRQAIFEALIEGGVNPYSTTQVMTMIADAYTRRLLQLAELELGTPPCDFAWVVAGSHARYEVHVNSDQDSALVLANNATDADRTWFKTFATKVCDGLAACGYPSCTGEFMAANPQWCQSLDVWKRYYDEWVMDPELEALLNVTVFLDMRCIYGNDDLADQLIDHLGGLIKGRKTFNSVLLKNNLRITPPLGMFRNFVLIREGDKSKTLNLKGQAINLIVDLARIYGLEANHMTGSTEERLNKALENNIISRKSHDNLVGAYRFIVLVRLRHQLAALKSGIKPDNHINPKHLSQFERNHLKDAFRIISEVQEVMKMRHQM